MAFGFENPFKKKKEGEEFKKETGEEWTARISKEYKNLAATTPEGAHKVWDKWPAERSIQMQEAIANAQSVDELITILHQHSEKVDDKMSMFYGESKDKELPYFVDDIVRELEQARELAKENTEESRRKLKDIIEYLPYGIGQKPLDFFAKEEAE